MRIAFASSDGVTVDCHFGLAETYYVWEIDQERAVCVGKVDSNLGCDLDDKTAARARALEGCTLVYSLQIGGPAAAKLIARHIHPLKTAEQPIQQLVVKLQATLNDRPPPWLCKAMGLRPKQILAFADGED
jgi:nitrogen fixation protein NifX